MGGKDCGGCGRETDHTSSRKVSERERRDHLCLKKKKGKAINVVVLVRGRGTRLTTRSRKGTKKEASNNCLCYALVLACFLWGCFGLIFVFPPSFGFDSIQLHSRTQCPLPHLLSHSHPGSICTLPSTLNPNDTKTHRTDPITAAAAAAAALHSLLPLPLPRRCPACAPRPATLRGPSRRS